MKYIVISLLAFLVSGCSGIQEPVSPKGTVYKWALTGFEKADSINPILSPSADQLFRAFQRHVTLRSQEIEKVDRTAEVCAALTWTARIALSWALTAELHDPDREGGS